MKSVYKNQPGWLGWFRQISVIAETVDFLDSELILDDINIPALHQIRLVQYFIVLKGTKVANVYPG